MTVYEDALKLHELHHGKLSIEPKVPCETPEDLTLAYTPGVAQPCLEINKDPENAYRYTGKGNTVAVVTDGTAVLGLGDIGAVAGLPVMEGKALLMHRFAGLDAFPICVLSLIHISFAVYPPKLSVSLTSSTMKSKNSLRIVSPCLP